MTGAFGAALLDLQRPDRPLGPLVNSAAPGLGLSLGAVGAGLAVEFLPSPTDWVFGLLTALCLVAAVVSYVAGVTAPPGKKMGHAGAIVSGGKGTAAAKMEALTDAGVKVGNNPTEAGELMVEIVRGLGL